MKSNKLKRKPSRLTLQILPIVLACIILVIMLFGYLLYNRTMEIALTEKSEGYQFVLKYLGTQLTEYESYPELIKYWHDNYEDMDLDWSYDNDYNTKVDEYDQLYLEHIADGEISDDEADVENKLFAELKYKSTLHDFNSMKAAINFKYLYLVSFEDADHTFFYMSATGPNDEELLANNEEIFHLGHIEHINLERYPVLSEIYNSHEAPEDFNEFKMSSRDEHIQVYEIYYPIYSDGELLAVIGGTFEDDTIVSHIRWQALKSVFIAIIIVCLGFSSLLIVIDKSLLTPIVKLQGYVTKFTQDKDEKSLASSISSIVGDNEIGYLSDDIAKLGTEFIRYTHEIEEMTQQTARINTELSLGRNIQQQALQSTFPAFPENKEFDLFAKSIPAKEVGGDFYDFYKIDDDHLVLVMADVSGKGVPAAIVMFSTMQLIKACVRGNHALSKEIERANNMICSSRASEMFITCWVGILTISTGEVTAVNAGHEYPIIAHKDNSFEVYKDKHNLVLGAMDDAPYTEYSFKLEKGDSLIVYTDGIPEATNKDNEQYGMDRFITTLNSVSDRNDLQKMFDVLIKSIEDFRADAEQFDDITALIFKYI